MIPGTTYHPRHTWEDPALPVDGPPIDWRRITRYVLHYTAADDLIDGDPGESADDLPGYMRAIQRSYENRQPSGYSFGYNVAGDWLGGIWEGRGFDIRAAANIGWNVRTFTHLCLVDGADPLTDEAVESVRKGLAEANRRAGRELIVTGHGEIGATACPGAGIREQIADGIFTPWTEPTTPPTPPPPIGDPAMAPVALLRLAGTAAVYAQYHGFKTWIPDPETMSAVRFFYPGLEVIDTTPAVVKAAGPIVGPFPPGVDGFGIPT